MGTCVDCSGSDKNPVGINGNVNPLDCNNQFMQCGNPCRADAKNTPQCETLPSQIQNFTDQFFGQVIKTTLNGEVVWSLPCSLDVGLPNNPRGVDEGLACYFLRLFRDGIGGLVGPQGIPGENGEDGTNTYSVTLQNFSQPTINSPLTQIVVVPNPSIVEGIGLFIQHSGSYQVTNVAPGGVIFVTLVSALSNALAVIPAGSLVVPVGVPGAGLGPVGPQGKTGPQGPQGNPGIPGSSLVNQNGQYSPVLVNGTIPAGYVDYNVTGFWQPVDYIQDKPGFAPPAAGTYLVNVVVPVFALAGATAADFTFVTLATSDGIFYLPSAQAVTSMSVGQTVLLPLTAIVTTTGTINQRVALRARSTNGGHYNLQANGTVITWVRIA